MWVSYGILRIENFERVIAGASSLLKPIEREQFDPIS